MIATPVRADIALDQKSTQVTVIGVLQGGRISTESG
jgi:hypothetical protein